MITPFIGSKATAPMGKRKQQPSDNFFLFQTGSKILFGLGGGLPTLGLNTEAAELSIQSASYPDWQDPSLPPSAIPQNRVNTTWGEMKNGEKH